MSSNGLEAPEFPEDVEYWGGLTPEVLKRGRQAPKSDARFREVIAKSTSPGAVELRKKFGVKAKGQAALRQAVREGRPVSVNVREISSYGPTSDRSFFRDLARVSAADQRTSAMIDNGWRPSGHSTESGFPVYGDGDLDEARSRVNRELRYLTSTGGAGWVTPGWIGQEMDTAARVEGKLLDYVTVKDAPPHGLVLRIPVQTDASEMAVTAEAGTVTNTAITTEYQDANAVTLVGEVQVTQQLLDRSGGLVDQQIAADLGRDFARMIDKQIISGTGSGQMQGLLTFTGITETSYTDASPTVPEYRAALWTLARDMQVASGLEPDVLIVGPTRHSWLWSGTASNSRQMLGIDLPARPVSVGAIPANLGTGTDQDVALMWRKDRVVLHRTPIKFRAVVDDDLSGHLAVRLQAYAHVFLHVTRPKAVGVLKGTGCVVPTL